MTHQLEVELRWLNRRDGRRVLQYRYTGADWIDVTSVNEEALPQARQAAVTVPPMASER